MFTQIQTKNGLLNLAELQQKMDELVFDHIDSSNNWEKAYKGLNNLLQQVVNHFNEYIDKQNGTIPSSNLYWNLFIDIVSKLVYFKTVAQQHLLNMENQEEREYILYSFKVAAACILDKGNGLLDEVSNSYEEIEYLNGVQGEFKQSILNEQYDFEKGLKSFYEYSTSYNKIKQAH